MRAIVEERGFEVLEDAGNMSGNFNSSFGVDEPATLDRVFDWIDSLEPEERFFLTYLPIAGHHPYATPEPGSFAADSEFGRYLNALEYGDGALGALLDGLKERGLYDDTLLVIFGDHGEAFGGHEGNFGHSFFIYDTNVRVPYLVAIPGITDDGVRVRDAISVVDTAPTILDLLGLPAPPEYQGASALSPEPRMALFYTDYALGWLGLYDDCRKYIFNIDSGRSELYDVCLDPGETRNLAPAEPQQVRAYRERVEAWAAAQILRFDEP
jgi:phosphoglycerol transferase MdoB-like AlkP superfamily enzyme